MEECYWNNHCGGCRCCGCPRNNPPVPSYLIYPTTPYPTYPWPMYPGVTYAANPSTDTSLVSFVVGVN